MTRKETEISVTHYRHTHTQAARHKSTSSIHTFKAAKIQHHLQYRQIQRCVITCIKPCIHTSPHKHKHPLYSDKQQTLFHFPNKDIRSCGGNTHNCIQQMSQPFVLIRGKNTLLIILANMVQANTSRSILKTGTVAITQETF